MCEEMDRLLEMVGAEADLKQKAESICRRGFTMNLERGRAMRSYVAAALYAAMRQSEKRMPLREFLLKIGVDTRKAVEITLYYGVFVRELDLSLPVQNPCGYILGIVQRLHEGEDLASRSEELLMDARQCSPEICGKNPQAVAAAAIYLGSLELKRTKSESIIAAAAGISERSLRTSVKVLREAQTKLTRAIA
jgi:transcription initiation factor TFIIB